MNKFFILSALSIAAWPYQVCRANNLKDAFKPGSFLDSFAGGSGFDVSQRSVDPIIGNIIFVGLTMLGVIFTMLMIYGGFTWMTAMGDDKKVTKAKDLITAAIIGLIVVVSAYMITFFVFARIAAQSIAI